MDLTRCELVPDLGVALSSGDDFTPGLGGQRVVLRRRGVPAASLGHVVDAGGDVGGKVEGAVTLTPAPVSGTGQALSHDGRGGGVEAGWILGVAGVPCDAVAYGGVDVAVGVFLQQTPDAAVRPEGHGAFLPRRVEQEGDDRVAGDIAGDVLLGVVGPHLLLVDVLLEDVAEHIRVDLVVLPAGALVEMPAIFVEEVEDPLEGGVGDADVGVVPLQVVYVEEATVEEGNPAEERGQIRRALGFGFSQAFVEQPQEEEAVEPLEASVSFDRLRTNGKVLLHLRTNGRAGLRMSGEVLHHLRTSGRAGLRMSGEVLHHLRSGRAGLRVNGEVLHHLEAVAQVVVVVVEEALLLDEVDEHHAVEHEGGVPVAVALCGDAVDEVAEGGKFRPEAVVEAPGDLLDVEGLADAGRDVRDADTLGLIFEAVGDVAEALEDGLASLSRVELLLAAGG